MTRASRRSICRWMTRGRGPSICSGPIVSGHDCPFPSRVYLRQFPSRVTRLRKTRATCSSRATTARRWSRCLRSTPAAVLSEFACRRIAGRAPSLHMASHHGSCPWQPAGIYLRIPPRVWRQEQHLAFGKNGSVQQHNRQGSGSISWPWDNLPDRSPSKHQVPVGHKDRPLVSLWDQVIRRWQVAEEGGMT